MKLGAVILAAGASSRMGRPKMLLPWGMTTVLGHLVAQWQARADLAVTIAPPPNPVAGELDRLGFPPDRRIVNPAPEQGMFSSIRCAARWGRWPEALTHWAIVLGDQPQISPASIDALLELARGHPSAIAQLSRGGKPRHPVILPRPDFLALRDTLAGNLREFLTERNRVQREAPDDSVDYDLDLPIDYAQAQARFLPPAKIFIDAVCGGAR